MSIQALFLNFYSSLFITSKKLETTQMFINRGIDKSIVYPHSGILLSHQKPNKPTDIHENMNKSQNAYTE